MDLLFSYRQEKRDRRNSALSTCDLKLFSDETNIEYVGVFDFDYNRYGNKKHITFEHHFNLNLINGDLYINYKIINDNLTEDKMFRNMFKGKKNDFKMLFDLVENSITRGEKRKGFWGVKYDRAVNNLIDDIVLKIKPKFKSKFYIDKDYKTKTYYNSIYDIILDFHLDIKGIKAHDNVYHDIQNEYPKKKWLEKNEYKYLPSVLDSYGIKSKYLIGELSKSGFNIQISALNYFCKLFGNNHVEYLKKFVWNIHCYDCAPNRRTHELKNDSEKSCLVSVINSWEKETLKTDSLIYNLNKMFTIRELLENRGMDLKFKAKNDNQFDNTIEMWSGLKLHFARGYRVKYDIDSEFLDFIQQDIEVDGDVFKPTMLLSEEDFRIEGYNMKNCMSKQFPHGAIYLFVSMQHKRKKINLQYRKGNLVQHYGKANTPTIDIFNKAIDILNHRFKQFPNIEWKKEKYDFITNSLSNN